MSSENYIYTQTENLGAAYSFNIAKYSDTGDLLTFIIKILHYNETRRSLGKNPKRKSSKVSVIRKQSARP